VSAPAAPVLIDDEAIEGTDVVNPAPCLRRAALKRMSREA
jgi:hypothetical protein